MLNNIYDGKTVLVTGASGLIGSNLVERLLLFSGIHVIALGRNIARMERVFRRQLRNPALKLMEHDVSVPLPPSLGVLDYVFHAAGPISGKIIRTEPVSVVSANLKGLVNCLDYLERQKSDSGCNGTLLVFSSATVYGNQHQEQVALGEQETMMAEVLDSPTAPYSESKRMVEVIARAYAAQYGLVVKIARFSYVYGYCEIAPATAFYEFIKKALNGEDLVFKQSGFARRDNIFIDDAVAGILHVCEHGTSGEAYNVSSNGEGGNFAAIDEIAAEISKSANADGVRNVRVIVPNSNVRGVGFLLDNTRLANLGWQVSTSLSDGVRAVFDAYERNKMCPIPNRYYNRGIQ